MIKDYHQLFYKSALDKAGQPVWTRDLARVADINKALTGVYQAYKSSSGEKSPKGFVEFVHTHAEYASAAGYLDQVGNLLRDVRDLGLTPMEFRLSEDSIDTKLGRLGIPSEYLEAAMEKPLVQANATPPAAGGKKAG